MGINDGITTAQTRLRYWCQFVLPAVFDDSLSYYELLAKVVEKLNGITEESNNLLTLIKANSESIEELEKLFEEFKESGFEDYYQEQIEQWIFEHMPEFISETVKMVFFGLTDDGYFCAYIPDSWEDIEFDTGAVYGTYTYGRLILRYDVDGSGVIDNTGYGAPGSIDPYQDLAAKVQQSYNALFTNLSEGGA